MVSIPSDEMSKLLHRLRTVLLRTLLLLGIAQLVAPGDASWKVLLGDLLPALTDTPRVSSRADASADDRAPSPFEQLQRSDDRAETDEVDAGRRRLRVRSAFPSPVPPKDFSEEFIRSRIEDRRNCRPPDSLG